MVNAVHDFQRLVTVAPGSSHLCGRRVVCGLCRASILAGLAKKMMPEYEGGFWHFIRLPDGGGYMMPDGDRFHLVNGENLFDRTVSADAAGIIVTAPRPVGRGFPLLRPQPSVRRIYAGLHGQKRRVPPPSVPVFLFAGC